MISGQISHARLQDAVLAALNDQIQQEVELLAEGTVSGWEDYMRRRGRIEGLREAIDVVLEAERKFRGE